MKNIRKIESLIDNYLRNSCNEEEYREAIEILKNPEYNLVLQSILSNKWMGLENEAVELTEEDKKDIRQSLSNIHHEINLYEENWEFKSNYKKISGILIKIAAGLFFPVLFLSLWHFITSRNPYPDTDSYITINTPAGSTIKTELPDGTAVWQNSGSTIKYPRNFNKRNRQVFLDGEAYFDVSSDKLHPFFVKTKDLLIEVTGTKFNVTGYKDEETTSIVLESGIISVKNLNSSSSQQKVLKPGDKLESSQAKGDILLHGIDVAKYISWINGKLIFRDDPIGEILKKLGRWYNVEIEVNDPKSKFSDLPFTMTIENESLPQILEYLKRAIPITIKEEKLVIKDNGKFNKHKYVIAYRN